MPLTITYLGHSGFLIDSGRHAIAVDPFLSGNPVAKHKPDDIRCSAIALTHGHSDHFGDTIPIARRNQATVYSVWEIYEYLTEKGLTRLEPGNPGGKIKTDFGFIAFVQAFHSSSYEGRYMGNPCGLIIHIAGHTIYHCGDTGLFSDMKLIAEIYKPDVAMIPCGDRFTMGPELASMAAEFIRPKVAIPIHFNTFPPITVDIAQFRPKGVEVKVMKPGESLSLD